MRDSIKSAQAAERGTDRKGSPSAAAARSASVVRDSIKSPQAAERGTDRKGSPSAAAARSASGARPSISRFFGIIPLFAFTLLLFAGGPGFRTRDQLDDHFAKHGREFGNITEEQYLKMAQHLRDSRPGKDVLESKRPDGGGAKFDRRRGWFVAYDGDGTIRTFFVPADGIRYFESQARAYAARSRH